MQTIYHSKSQRTLGHECMDTACDGARAGEGGVTRTTFGGEAVPFFAQINAQNNFASATWGVSFCRSAVLQQSISSSMPSMLHSLSPKGRGTPAKALPANPTKGLRMRTRSITLALYGKMRTRVNP